MVGTDLKTRLGASRVWFALGMIVTGVVGTIAALTWLEGFVDKRVQAAGTSFVPGAVPAGAVMAFDLPTGCPDGWGAFEDAGGRAVIGAGAGMIPGTEERDLNIQTKKYRQHGGDEKVTLTISEMPGHDHSEGTLEATAPNPFMHVTPAGTPLSGGTASSLWDPNPDHTGGANFSDGHTHAITGSTGSEGGGVAHNNMPPYIALYFCKKD